MCDDQSPRENSSCVEPRHLLFPRQTSLRSAAVVIVKKDRSGKYSPLQVCSLQGGPNNFFTDVCYCRHSIATKRLPKLGRFGGALWAPPAGWRGGERRPQKHCCYAVSMVATILVLTF